MSIGILGKKIGMTRVYDDAGVATPVTVIHAEPNIVSQVKSVEKDGYAAAQLGVGRKSAKQAANAQLAHFKKVNSDPKAFIREFHVEEGEEVELGKEITVSRFAPGQFVDVIGTSRGKGFQGVMKRHNFAGQPDSHGSKMHRRPGAVGLGSTPGRVFKNQKMPGHQGSTRITVQNLRVVQVREDDNVLLIRGAIPGAKGSYVVVRQAKKKAPVTAE